MSGSKNLIIVEVEDGAIEETHHYGTGNVEVIAVDWSDMEASAYSATEMLETLAGASQGALGPPPVGLAAIKARLQDIIDEEAAANEEEEEDEDDFDLDDEDGDLFDSDEADEAEADAIHEEREPFDLDMEIY